MAIFVGSVIDSSCSALRPILGSEKNEGDREPGQVDKEKEEDGVRDHREDDAQHSTD